MGRSSKHFDNPSCYESVRIEPFRTRAGWPGLSQPARSPPAAFTALTRPGCAAVLRVRGTGYEDMWLLQRHKPSALSQWTAR